MDVGRISLIVSSFLLAGSFDAAATGVFAPDRADKGSLSGFPIRMVPVLVRVDANGRIGHIAPAYELTPAFNRLLNKNVSEMISGPAVDKHGRPIPSQFILNLALSGTARDDGSYDAQFQYVSTQPVPSGKWTWSHIDGHRIALLDQSRPRFDRPMPAIQRSEIGRTQYQPPAPTPRPAGAMKSSSPQADRGN